MDTLSSAPDAVNLRGPTKAEAEAVARLIGYPAENAPETVKPKYRARYDDIDVHRQAGTQWPDGPLPKLSGEEAIRAAKRLWRKAVGLAWPGTWTAGRGNHRTGPRGNVFRVNPGQGWRDIVHDLSHDAYRYLTTPRPHAAHLGYWMGKDKGWSRSRTLGTREGMQPICSEARIAEFEYVRRRDTAGRRIHHSDSHAELEREMIRMVLANGWLDGRLKPAPKPRKPRRKAKPIRFTLN